MWCFLFGVAESDDELHSHGLGSEVAVALAVDLGGDEIGLVDHAVCLAATQHTVVGLLEAFGLELFGREHDVVQSLLLEAEHGDLHSRIFLGPGGALAFHHFADHAVERSLGIEQTALLLQLADGAGLLSVTAETGRIAILLFLGTSGGGLGGSSGSGSHDQLDGLLGVLSGLAIDLLDAGLLARSALGGVGFLGALPFQGGLLGLLAPRSGGATSGSACDCHFGVCVCVVKCKRSGCVWPRQKKRKKRERSEGNELAGMEERKKSLTLNQLTR